ncbi:hypothetical protein [Ferrimicrobium sp.]|nr:hypothetical protein [Ferrimicrobium sp.]
MARIVSFRIAFCTCNVQGVGVSHPEEKSDGGLALLNYLPDHSCAKAL